MTRMHFLIDPSLKQQLSYLKVQVKFQHMQELYQKFDNMKDDMIENVQEQIEVFGSVYQWRINTISISPYRDVKTTQKLFYA